MRWIGTGEPGAQALDGWEGKETQVPFNPKWKALDTGHGECLAVDSLTDAAGQGSIKLGGCWGVKQKGQARKV